MAFTVCMQSSLGRNPRSVQTPFDSAATITARCEMLLSPGTVISMSIRGARFTRNSMANKKGTDTGCLNAAQWKARTALIRHPVYTTQHRRNRLNHCGCRLLRHEKDLVGVRILHLGSRRKSFDIDIFSRGIRTLHQVRFARDRNSIRIISLRDFCRRGCRGRRGRRLFYWRLIRGLNWPVRIEGLLRRRIFRGLGGIPGGSVVGGWRRRRLFRAGDEDKGRNQRKRR